MPFFLAGERRAKWLFFQPVLSMHKLYYYSYDGRSAMTCWVEAFVPKRVVFAEGTKRCGLMTKLDSPGRLAAFEAGPPVECALCEGET